jgi:hypothetical protein
MSVRSVACWCAGVMALALVAAAPPQSDRQQRLVAELIGKLGDDDFDVREDAQKQLKRIGKPAVEQLARAFLAGGDLEVRKRTGKLLDELDPGFLVRQQRRQRQRALARAIAGVESGTDATTWGESIANPFTALSEEGKKKLRVEGVEVDRLLKMRARLITGNYCGAMRKTFVNRDPDVILVFGKGFITHANVHSLGPVLAVKDAHFMSDVTGADLVWFVDETFPRGRTSGLPLALAPTARTNQMKSVGRDVLSGDFGWRAPEDLCKPLLAETKADPAATRELAAARKKLTAQIKGVEGEDVKKHGKAVANPFTNLTDEGKKKLKTRGIDVDRLVGLKKAVYLTGGGRTRLVNADPDVVLILGKGFRTGHSIYSLGPVLALDDAHVAGEVTGADVVWFVDKSCPCRTTTGAPVILAPTANRFSISEGSKHVWHGDYGWRRPEKWPEVEAKKD